MLRAERNAGLRTRCAPATLPLMLVIALLIGCANPSAPVVSPIEFTNAAGAPISAVATLAVNQPVYLVAAVSNDSDVLGVSWTVACGSGGSGGTVINTACGICNPAQTASGPVPTYPSTGIITTYTAPSVIPKGGTVTITAHATSLPSIYSSVTLTIVEAQEAKITLPKPALTMKLQRPGV